MSDILEVERNKKLKIKGGNRNDIGMDEKIVILSIFLFMLFSKSLQAHDNYIIDTAPPLSVCEFKINGIDLRGSRIIGTKENIRSFYMLSQELKNFTKNIKIHSCAAALNNYQRQLDKKKIIDEIDYILDKIAVKYDFPIYHDIKIETVPIKSFSQLVQSSVSGSDSPPPPPSSTSDISTSNTPPTPASDDKENENSCKLKSKICIDSTTGQADMTLSCGGVSVEVSSDGVTSLSLSDESSNTEIKLNDKIP